MTTWRRASPAKVGLAPPPRLWGHTPFPWGLTSTPPPPPPSVCHGGTGLVNSSAGCSRCPWSTCPHLHFVPAPKAQGSRAKRPPPVRASGALTSCGSTSGGQLGQVGSSCPAPQLTSPPSPPHLPCPSLLRHRSQPGGGGGRLPRLRSNSPLQPRCPACSANPDNGKPGGGRGITTAPPPPQGSSWLPTCPGGDGGGGSRGSG